MESVSQELERKTQYYWGISKAFYAGVGIDLNTAQALKGCNDTLNTLNTARPLCRRTEHLQGRIIQGRGKRRKTDKAVNVITVLHPIAL